MVREFSPDALAIMEFVNQTDIDICTKMYDCFPKFGEKIKDLPYRHYMAEVHMGNDRELFTEDSSGLPVFEGRMVGGFDYRAKAYISGRGRAATWEDLPFGDPKKAIYPQWYVLEKHLPHKLESRVRQYRIGLCDVASPTNERSLVAALIPPNTVCGDKVPTILFDPDRPDLMMLWLGIANSMTMDFLVRKKISLKMSYTVMDSLPFPRSIESNGPTFGIAKRALLLTCAGSEMADFFRCTAVLLDCSPDIENPAVNPEERERLHAEIEVLVARDLFGVTRDEMRYILDPADLYGAECPIETFRVLKNNEIKEFGEYRTQRLVLQTWDRLQA
jgi:hypothetical protein